MMAIFPWTRAYRAKKLARETDFGRRYGWFIERDGERIGELDYIRWDSLAQFWHEYSIIWHKEAESSIETDPDAWIERKIVLRSRRYPDVLISGFLTAARTKGVIAVRFASVPIERFEKDDTA
jgi:hypothetical protein